MEQHPAFFVGKSEEEGDRDRTDSVRDIPERRQEREAFFMA
jgi:hypothetical protein